MAKNKKWTRRADARPEELAQAALELCSERGAQGTRVADVADRAGVTVGTVYRYFRDKDALIEAAIMHASHPARRVSAPDRPGTALPALADALRRWGSFFRDTGARSLRIALSDPRRDSTAPHAIVHEAIVEIAGLVAQGIDRKDLRGDLEPSAIARALVGALLLAPVLGDEAGSATGDVEAITALAARGLRPDGPLWRQPAG